MNNPLLHVEHTRTILFKKSRERTGLELVRVPVKQHLPRADRARAAKEGLDKGKILRILILLPWVQRHILNCRIAPRPLPIVPSPR